MSIRMTHPEHGVTHAVGAEIAWNQAHGWRIDEHEAATKPAPVAAPMSIEEAAEEADEIHEKTLAERYAEKFGKPPHHRMKPETIEAALED